jgi:UDP-N-acetylmuramate--alanine ligase
VVVVTDIYSAGEKNTFDISSLDLVEAIAMHHNNVHYYPDVDSIDYFIKEEILQPGDLAMFLGAGNLNQAIPKTIALYQLSGGQEESFCS